MPKRRRRSFTPQFKAQVVLEVLTGLKSPSEVARQHKLKPELIARWKDIALEGLESLFQGGGSTGPGPGPHRQAGADGRAPVDGARSRKKSLGLAPLSPEARRQIVLTLMDEYPVRLICRATGWPRSSVYQPAAPPVDEGRLRRAIGRLAAR
jgi:transposase-like protein